MKKIIFFLILILSFSKVFSQNIGIGTTTPNSNALLHIDLATSTNKGLLVTGNFNLPSTIPDLGAGSRMMFYPGKAAFRAGFVNGPQWDNLHVGDYSTAVGDGTIASGASSTAMGRGTTASGAASTAIGYLTTASGDLSTAMGGSTWASGDYSTAQGGSTIASGTYSTAMGRISRASGYASTAMGVSTIAKGGYSTAMGYFTTASAIFSTSLGLDTKAKGYGSTVLGIYNDSIVMADEISPVSTTPLLIIGNGDGHSSRSNAMVVRKDGNVGIGTNIPDGRIHTKANSTIFFPQLMLEESENDYARLSFKNTVTPNFWTIAATPQLTNAASLMNFYFKGSGDVLSLRGDGNATLMGTLTQLSDKRLKTNILPIASSLSQIIKLNGYQYNWKDEKKDQSLQLGLLAQEVEKIFPELVKKDEQGLLSVNYSGFIPVLINAIKEQQQQIISQQEVINKMEQRLIALEKK